MVLATNIGRSMVWTSLVAQGSPEISCSSLTNYPTDRRSLMIVSKEAIMTQPNPHRRDEILDAAERRFITQGYLATSVAELLADTGIAKGTFYHHFASKEAVMDAVIARHLGRLSALAQQVADQREVPALQRFMLLLGGQRPENDEGLTTELERDGNELMRMRALNATVTALTPPLAQIFADGVAEGTFKIADPEATAAVFITITTQLVDRDLLGWVRRRDLQRLGGLLQAAEQLLGAEAGTLSPIVERLAGEGE